jgi:hypothetical protein
MTLATARKSARSASVPSSETSLMDICEPLFQHVCRLHRAGRKSAEGGGAAIAGDQHEARARLRELIGESGELAEQASQAGILDQFEKVRLPLVFFCDYVIQHSTLPFAAEWQPMAEVDEDPPHLGWYQEFFAMLDDTLAEHSDAAEERLAVFYTCLGLGFKGYFEDMPKFLQDKMREIQNRVRGRIETDSSRDICDQAYKHTDKRQLEMPPIKTLTPIILVLLGLIVTLFVLNLYLYHDASGQLKKAIDTVVEKNDQEVKNLDKPVKAGAP